MAAGRQEVRKRGRPAGRNSSPGSGQIQSLTRGMRLLECLADSEDGAVLTDLAQQLELAPSTTHRLLVSFQQHQFVRHDPFLGKWFIGVGAFAIGNAFLHHRDYLVQSRPVMHQLMEVTGETVNLALVEGGRAVFVAQVESPEMMRMVVPLGSRALLHASGVGKAFLATMPQEDVDAVLEQHGMQMLTARTLSTPQALAADLSAIRQRGYAIDNEEQAVGLRCVAATIHDEQARAVAAISVSGPKARISDDYFAELGRQVMLGAEEITRHIGGQRPGFLARALS